MRQGCSSHRDGLWHWEDPGDPGVGVECVRKVCMFGTHVLWTFSLNLCFPVDLSIHFRVENPGIQFTFVKLKRVSEKTQS